MPCKWKMLAMQHTGTTSTLLMYTTSEEFTHEEWMTGWGNTVTDLYDVEYLDHTKIRGLKQLHCLRLCHAIVIVQLPFHRQS